MEMFKLIPSVADYIWGGRRLIEEYGIKTDKDPAAEAWVLSCHSAGPSTVEDGEFKGQTLEQVWENHKEICGTNGNKFEFFPILIKFIDAKNNLSIQVHPDNDYAMRVEGEYGKTEAWYILDCDEGAELILGFNREVSVEEFKKAAQSEEMLNIVNKVKVKKGDLFFIESGTLHAICKGILLAEVQQNSNTTYRVYDYGRVGADGKPRALHIDKAADVTKLCPPTIPNASERAVEKQIVVLKIERQSTVLGLFRKGRLTTAGVLPAGLGNLVSDCVDQYGVATADAVELLKYSIRFNQKVYTDNPVHIWSKDGETKTISEKQFVESIQKNVAQWVKDLIKTCEPILQAGPTTVIITGEGGETEGLSDLLSESLGCSVKCYIPETLGGRNAGLTAPLGLLYAYQDKLPITGYIDDSLDMDAFKKSVSYREKKKEIDSKEDTLTSKLKGLFFENKAK